MSIPSHEIFALMVYQLGEFQALAQSLGLRPRHVKPHGALYNMAARDDAIGGSGRARNCRGRSELDFVRAGEKCVGARSEKAKAPGRREVFADRNYLPNGALVPRDRPDALLHDAAEAAARVLKMLREHRVRAIEGSEVEVHAETICVHGDTRGAVEFVQQLRAALDRNGVAVRAIA